MTAPTEEGFAEAPLHERVSALPDGEVSIAGVPWLTLALLGSCLAVLALSGGLRAGLPVAKVLAYGAKAMPLVLDRGETWRLFTANFLHKDVLHFAFNAFAIWNVGGPLERATRTADYLALLLATALGTTIASAIFADSISLGSSGIAFGLLAAAAAFGWRRSVGGALRAHFGLRLLPWVGALFAAGIGSQGVDNWGHVGGLAAGAALGFFISPRGTTDDGAHRRLAGALGGLAGVLLVGALAGPALPLLGSPRDGPLGAQLRFPIGWRRADSGAARLSFTNGLAGGFRASASLWSSGAEASACPGNLRPCSCARSGPLMRALLERDLYRLADVGTLRAVDVGPGELLPGGGTLVRGVARGSDGEADLAAICSSSAGGPSALLVLMPAGSGDEADRLARRILATVEPAAKR